MLYYILRYTITPLARLLFRVKIYGKENLPQKGVYILASNHNDNSDPVFLSMLTHKRTCFLAKHELLLPPNKIRVIIRNVRKYLVFIEVGKGKSKTAVAQAVKLLKNGFLFSIFPEGTTKGKENILQAHRGVARIALKARVPVVPVAIIGNEYTYQGKDVLPRRIPKVILNIGKPIWFEKYYQDYNDRKITKKLADEVMEEIKKLYYQYYKPNKNLIRHQERYMKNKKKGDK